MIKSFVKNLEYEFQIMNKVSQNILKAYFFLNMDDQFIKFIDEVFFGSENKNFRNKRFNQESIKKILKEFEPKIFQKINDKKENKNLTSINSLKESKTEAKNLIDYKEKENHNLFSFDQILQTPTKNKFQDIYKSTLNENLSRLLEQKKEYSKVINLLTTKLNILDEKIHNYYSKTNLENSNFSSFFQKTKPNKLEIPIPSYSSYLKKRPFREYQENSQNSFEKKQFLTMRFNFS